MYFAHHGIKGQKWGVRRFQNEDGSLTPEGKKRREEYMTFIRDEYSKNDSSYRMSDIATKFFDSKLGQDFINDKDVSKIYKKRNAVYDNFSDYTTYNKEIEDGYIAGTKFEKQMRKQVQNLLKDYADVKISRIADGKERTTTAENFVMRMIEEADLADDMHKYSHEKAWLHWH